MTRRVARLSFELQFPSSLIFFSAGDIRRIVGLADRFLRSLLRDAPSGEDELRSLVDLPRGLHRGEGSSLAIALHRDWTFLTDDLASGMIAIPNALRQRIRWIVGAA